MRNKYSPSNYVPACLRNNDNITRSKSINDIGKPPIERNEKSTKNKVNESFNYSNGLGVTNLSNNTNSLEKMCDNVLNEDDNGNRASVAEIRKKFDQSNSYKDSKTENLTIEGTGIKISENRFKKQDSLDGTSSSKPKFTKLTKKDKKSDNLILVNGYSFKKDKDIDVKRPAKYSKLDQDNSSNDKEKQISDVRNFDSLSQKCSTDTNKINNCSKLNVSDQVNGTGPLQNGHQVGRDSDSTHSEVECENNAEISDNTGEFYRNFNHTTNFASYIPSKDLQQGDTECNAEGQIINGISQGNDMENRNFVNDHNRYYQSSKINNVSFLSMGNCNSVFAFVYFFF